MDWLNDKKNQPIIAAVLAVVILGAAVAVYFLYFKGDSAPPPSDGAAMPDATSPAPGSGAPGDFGQTATMPGESTTPASAPATPQPAATAAAGSDISEPMERWRPDPFLPPGYRPPKTGGIKLKAHIRDLPTFKIPMPTDVVFKKPPKPDYPQPARRMAGLILGDKVYAIIESGGKNQVVQPGDMLEDRLASVFKIEKDRVILRTIDEKPRYLVVRMSQGVRTQDVTATSTTSPRYPRPGPMPGPGAFPGGPGEGLPAPN